MWFDARFLIILFLVILICESKMLKRQTKTGLSRFKSRSYTVLNVKFVENDCLLLVN